MDGASRPHDIVQPDLSIRIGRIDWTVRLPPGQHACYRRSNMRRLLSLGLATVISACLPERTPGPFEDPDVPVQPDHPWRWGAASPIEGTTAGRAPLLKADAAGNAIAVWLLGDGDTERLWASRFDAETAGWSALTVIADGHRWISGVHLEGNRAGDAVVVWSGCDSDNRCIASGCRYEVGAGWAAAATLGVSTDLIRAAMNDVGDVLVVWSAKPELVARLYQPGSGWRETERMTSGELIQGWNPYGAMFDVSVEPGGRLLVVWAQEGEGAEVWARRGAQSRGSVGAAVWDEPELLASNGPYRLGKLAARLDDTATASVVWAHLDAMNGSQLAMSRAAPDGAWTSPAGFTGPIPSMYGYFPNDARLASNAAGGWIALWREEHDEKGRIVTTRYVPGTGWTAPDTVVDGLEIPYGCTFDGMPDAVTVALDDDGGALVLWEDRDVEEGVAIRIGASRLTADGWSARVIVSQGEGRAESPVAALAGGSGFALWERADPTSWVKQIWSSQLVQGGDLRRRIATSWRP
jgi:hypothetical protein